MRCIGKMTRGHDSAHASSRDATETVGKKSFEETLTAVSNAIQKQRREGRRQLAGPVRKKSGRGSLSKSILKMISAVTDTSLPTSVDEKTLVKWVRDTITQFGEARAARSRRSDHQLPPRTAAEVFQLIDRLSLLLE